MKLGNKEWNHLEETSNFNDNVTVQEKIDSNSRVVGVTKSLGLPLFQNVLWIKLFT